MDQWLILIIALASIALVVAALLLWRSFRYPAEPLPPVASSSAPPAEARDGTTLIMVAPLDRSSATGQQPWHGQIARQPLGRSLALGLVLFTLLVGGLTFVVLRSMPERYDRLVVLVAPFDDAADGQTGRNIAASLVDLLRREADGSLDARLVESRPANVQEALNLANANDADLLIWGAVEQGAVLDSPSLLPRLIYTPRGPITPNSWDGYANRFVMPRSFTLASQPINGQAVLPPLLTALANYNRQSADLAFDPLGQLVDNYPLNPSLPRALRGNILWARGIYEQAAAEYRLALATPTDDQAFLANNLGALLLDAGDPNALTALAEAVRLLDGNDLAALRYNLGIQALRARSYAEAASNLEQATNLLATNVNVSLFTALAEAYREQGKLDDATTTLNAAEQQISIDALLVSRPYRDLATQRAQATLQAQRAMLGLARQIGAQGRIGWWIEVAPAQPSSQMGTLRNDIRSAIVNAERAVAGWRQRSTSESASAANSGQIADGQAQRFELAIERQRYYQTLIQVETDRSRLGQSRRGPGQFIDAILTAGQPMGESLRLLDTLSASLPNNAEIFATYGRALRLAGDYNQANQRYDQAIALAADQPEGYFGKGQIALDLGDPNGARPFFNQALERNPAFFPARAQLAYLDEGSGDLTTAIAHYRQLLAEQPGPAAAVNLARVLRKSGPGGYPEAEETLSVYKETSSAALVELGFLYREAQRPDRARSSFESALRLDPQSNAANYELGEILIESGDLAGAETRFLAAIGNNDRDLEARLALAMLYQGPLNQPRAAIDQYRAVLRIGVTNPDLSVSIGDVMVKNDAAVYAVDAYSQALRQRPNDPAIHLKLATTYLTLDRISAATEEAQRVISLTPDPNNAGQVQLRADGLVALGDAERLSSRAQSAIEHYNQALVLSPQSFGAIGGLGQAAIGQNNWGVALGYFERASGLPGGVDDPTTQFWLAEALLHNNSLQRAAQIYERALALRPIFPEALLGLAQVRYTLGDPTAAEQTVDRALNQRTAYAEGLLFKGKLQQERGLIDAALASYSASIRANSRIAETYFRRGLLFIRQTDYNRAISDLRRSTELEPNGAEAFYWLGRAYYAVDTGNSALEAFQRAMVLQPTFTEARYYQGLVEEDLGQRQAAATSFQAVIAADGSGQWGARSKAQLDNLGN